MEFTKRRRLFKTNFFSLRFIFVFSVLIFLLLLSHRFRVFNSTFRPARIVPTISVLSSSVSNSILTIPTSTHFTLPELRIQARVILPDSLLILLDKDFQNQNPLELHADHEIECFYHKDSIFLPVISIDEYDKFRWMVRCPLPSANNSLSVSLRWHDGGLTGGSDGALSIPAWDRVAYEAVVDDGTAVVFVKGFNLRRDKEFDPKQLLCRFESGVTTIPIAAAQEIVRCPLPDRLFHSETDNNNGVKVAVDWPKSGQLLPSVARLYSENRQFKNRGGDLFLHQLCGCTMVWNQAHALREWVVYHARLGVQRWFIYDNNSEDGLKSGINKLNSEGYNITRHTWPWIKTQEAGFSHCVLRSKKECRWIAFFDVDEFFYFPPSKRGKINSNGLNSMGNLVDKYSNQSGMGEIRTKCRSFGPSGMTSYPPRGVTVGYTCRLKSTERHKSIIRPEAVEMTLANVVHHFKLKKGFISKNAPESLIVINHYKYQAWDAFKSKFSRRVSTYVADWGESLNEGSKDRAPGLGKEPVQPKDWNRWFCEVWDTGLRDFVVANLAHLDSGLLPWERSVSSSI
ncbi:hypothetical protein V2J09_015391 [Rumex salicifolius]